MFSRYWFDVLIGPKKIVGIELVLEHGQPFVFVSVGCADASLTLIFQVIECFVIQCIEFSEDGDHWDCKENVLGN